LEAHAVSTVDYRRWLEQADFAESLRFWLDTARRQAVMMIAVCAPKAAERLLQLTADKKPEVARRACLDILTLHKTLAEGADRTSGETASTPDIDTATAAVILEAIAKQKQKETAPAAGAQRDRGGSPKP